MINKYTDPIITNYRFDKVGSRASVPITESLTINNGFLFLKEIPDRNNVVTIGNLVEVQKPEELDSETKFYIDYNAGIVYFDSKLNGTKVNVEYSGIGIVYYPASRIYLEVDENHEIVRTLSDIEGQLSSLTNLKNQQERLKQEIEERNGNLNKTIEEARTINLDGSVEKAKKAKTELVGATSKANTTKSDLDAKINLANNTKADLKNQEEQSKAEIQKSVNLANTTKTSLDGSITSANEKINKANEKVNEISSKIGEANETQQKLTTTKDDIAASLSDYDKKSAEIKSSAGEIESKNDELKSTISRADESNSTLNATIEKSKESNTTLSETVEESKTKNTELSSSITTATDLKGQLDTKNKEAKDNVTSISGKIDEGTQLKNELDTSTTNANQANTELKDTTNKANLSKTALDESKTSADELNKNLLNNKNELTTLNNSLKAENEKATKNISELDTKSASGKRIIDDLNSATLKSETAKTNLDESNTKAIQTNKELKATTQTANDTKTSLEQIKSESSILSNELSEKNTTASSNIESLKSENQTAKTNITGLQTENQNALSKQETLSSETAKANEAIEKIAELITSSTDLKNKLEQIVASGDLDKYITDPKLREILTAYATKDDLSKVDLTEKLKDYVKTNELVEALNELNESISAKIDKSNFEEAVAMLNNNIENRMKEKADKSSIPTLVSQLENDINYQNKENVDNAINNVVRKSYIRTIGANAVDQTKHKLGIKLYGKLYGNYPISRYAVLTYANVRGKLRSYSSFALNFNNYKCYERFPINQSSMKYDESKNILTGEWGEWKECTTQIATTQDLELKADKDSIPTSLSQLTNDTNFKTETEIQEMIANSSKLKKEVTTSLPSTGKDDVIYLVKDDKGKDNNNYLEYLWIDGKWELIGSTQVDLSGYATHKDLNDSIGHAFTKLVDKIDIIAKSQQNTLDKDKDKAISGDNGTDVMDNTTYTTPEYVNWLFTIFTTEQFNQYEEAIVGLNEAKLDKSDLSPFTQQELEEAFK